MVLWRQSQKQRKNFRLPRNSLTMKQNLVPLPQLKQPRKNSQQLLVQYHFPFVQFRMALQGRRGSIAVFALHLIGWDDHLFALMWRTDYHGITLAITMGVEHAYAFRPIIVCISFFSVLPDTGIAVLHQSRHVRC